METAYERVVRTPELVSRIIKHFTADPYASTRRRSLLAFARTSQKFFVLCAGEIWSSLPSLKPMLNLLPSFMVRDLSLRSIQTAAELRPVVLQEDLSRWIFYSQFVKEVKDPSLTSCINTRLCPRTKKATRIHSALTLIHLLIVHLPNRILLPTLVTVEMASKSSIQLIQAVISPGLQEFVCHPSHLAQQLETSACLERCCSISSLRRFVLGVGLDDTALLNRCLEVNKKLEQLEIFEYWLVPTILARISTLSWLRSLVLGGVEPDRQNETERDHPQLCYGQSNPTAMPRNLVIHSFPHLNDLRMVGECATAAAFLYACQPPIVNVSLTVRVSSPTELHELSRSLRLCSQRHQRLHLVRLTVSGGMDDDWWNTMRHLKAVDMKGFWMTVSWDPKSTAPAIEGTLFEDVSRVWPSIPSLCFEGFNCNSTITLRDLLPLSQCRALKEPHIPCVAPVQSSEKKTAICPQPKGETNKVSLGTTDMKTMGRAIVFGSALWPNASLSIGKHVRANEYQSWTHSAEQWLEKLGFRGQFIPGVTLLKVG